MMAEQEMPRSRSRCKSGTGSSTSSSRGPPEQISVRQGNAQPKRELEQLKSNQSPYSECNPQRSSRVCLWVVPIYT